MKTKLIYAMFLILIVILNCSKDDSVDSDTEITLTRCFTIKELGTEIPISNAYVVLGGRGLICSVGCAGNTIAEKYTESNGEVCFNLTQSENEEITNIRCIKVGYKPYIKTTPQLDFKEIYLEPYSY